MIDVVLDACVLYSASLRDLLMNTAAENVVKVHWSDEIHEEWIRKKIWPLTMSKTFHRTTSLILPGRLIRKASAAQKHRLKLKRPPKSVTEYLETLRRQGLTKTVAFLEEHRSEI